MTIPQATVDRIMHRCGRRCCICRRFAPLQLQVHHIVERQDRGSDDEDNLIALCANCHVSAHTSTKMSRAFTPAEIKQHREAVYHAVESGTLVEGVESSIDLLLQPLIEALRSVGTRQSSPLNADAITPEGLEILAVTIMAKDQLLYVHETPAGLLMEAGDPSHHLLDRNNPRRESEFRHALEQLLMLGLMKLVPRGNMFYITHAGYLFTDRLIASGQLILHRYETEKP